MKLSIHFLPIFAVTLMGVVFLSLSPSVTRSQQTQNPSSNSYPTEEKASFVNSCARNNDAQFRAICECTFNKIQQTYSYTEYQNIRQQLENGENLPERVVRMIRECRNNPNSD